MSHICILYFACRKYFDKMLSVCLVGVGAFITIPRRITDLETTGAAECKRKVVIT